MNSSRLRYKHITPSSPEDIMEASMQSGMANVRKYTNRQRADQEFALGKFTYCGKEGGTSVKICSRCKAAKYCDQACQLADFKPRHKRECANFMNPPETSAFLAKPVTNQPYAMQPVFASGHVDSVGCWVSVEGQTDCDAFGENSKNKDRKERIAGGADKGRGTIRRYKAAVRSHLGLRVLVQNRRKDNQPILVFGSRMQVVSHGSMTVAMSRGSTISDNGGAFVGDSATRLAAGVAKDPWDKVPRLEIINVNGQDVSPDKTPLPSNIKDATDGIVAFKTGEYAIFNAQFRVGDGDTIAKDWEALACLETFHIPYVIWDGASAPSALASSLPMADTNPPVGGARGPGRGLTARFDQAAVRAYYTDFIERGEQAYIDSHYRDVGTGMGAEKLIQMMGELMRGGGGA
ncbi:hypothetical protein OH76DRAFT_1451320 [Lentinus brumalis]|uniref:MYND-type domain-containing protein n=1 Tax=Lentinus brumalis TaxID=2498619 RepID=A0A371DXQ6_9APHY|nr:hypothetical protein OH76DRAFT_1451320 [Polyporus brumalis]